MIITNKLKERFCRDCKIPIKLFAEPYFNERLALYNSHFDTFSKWIEFTETLDKYENEEEYFAAYNKCKDDAINFIKSTDAYNEFNSIDMNQFAIKNKGLPSKDIFHESNIGRRFISVDMKKANFSALRYYNSSIFDDAPTWEDFIRKFTDNEYIVKSKYIREVILGNCNPKRHITYEKYLMDNFLTNCIEAGIDINTVVFFSNDEIIFDITDLNTVELTNIENIISNQITKAPIPFRLEIFTLKGIKRKDLDSYIGYIKEFTDGTKEFKCLNSLTYPFVLRYFNNECIIESDVIFEYEGTLAKLIRSIDIDIVDKLEV